MNLQRLVGSCRDAFLALPAYEDHPDGEPQANTLRLATIGVVDELSVEDRLDVVGDLLRFNSDRVLVRSHDEIFQTSDAPDTFITDLICEIVWQALMHDLQVRVEDEIRQALATG